MAPPISRGKANCAGASSMQSEKIDTGRVVQSTWMAGLAAGAAAFVPFDSWAQTTSQPRSGASAADAPLPSITVEAPRRRAAAPARTAEPRQSARAAPRRGRNRRQVASPSPAPAAEPAPSAVPVAGGGPGGDGLTPAQRTNTQNAGTQIGRLPGRVQDIPQIINVVPQEIIQQQNVTTLEQALRNVPGITVAIGEANGGPNGDRFRIRGFEAIGDNYSDGLRDFGVYVRDSFNIEQVQVLKGPSSEAFGIGTTGGAINTTSKQAKLGSFYGIDGSFGSGPLSRGTFDVNQQINDTTALRVTGMVNDQDLVGRDGVKSDRWGIASSLGMGIGTDKTWYLNYFHQSNDRTPDYGIPMIGRSAVSVREPLTEFGVPRGNYYGKSTDRDRTNVDLLTSRFKMDVTDWLTLSNDTRLTFYDRYYSQTTATCDQACANTFFKGGNPFLVYGAGGGATYHQEAWGLQNLTTGVAKFETGFLRHELVFGFDYVYQDNKRYGYSYFPNKNPIPTIWVPNTFANYGILRNPNNDRYANSTDYAFFASDRIWLTDWLSVQGGARWDHFEGNFTQKTLTTSTAVDANASTWSPKASIILEPIKDQMFYVSYATSAVLPFAQNGIAVDVTPINGTTRTADPQINTTYEAGTKLNFMEGRLGLTGAVFQVKKNNSYYTDPTSGNMVQTGDTQRVRGFETGLTGRLTDEWTINIAYAYMTSRTLRSPTAPANVGNPVPGVPTNSGSLWTTYNLSPALSIPGTLLVGGGVTFRDGVFIRPDMMAKVPYSFALDALVSYEYENWRIALNGYNLTDRVNYDSFFQGENLNTARAIPSAGRAVVLTIGAKF